MNKRLLILTGLILSVSGISMAGLDATKLKTQQASLLSAIKSDSTAIMQQAVQSIVTNGDSNKSATSVLVKAIMNGSTEEIKQALQPVLLKEGQNNLSPISLAILLKKPNAVGVLLDCGVNADFKALEYALKMEDIKTMLLLVKSNADISAFMDSYMKFGIQHAVWNTYAQDKDIAVKLIQELINRGYDVNKIWRLLQFNSHPHFPDMQWKRLINLLMANKANLNYITTLDACDSRTPLVMAIIGGGNKSIAETLLDLGADINQKVMQKGLSVTPLAQTIDSTLNGSLKAEIIALLLERGAQL